MNLLNRLISTEHPESPMLVTQLFAAVAFPLALLAIVWVCCRVIDRTGNLGSGACWALGLAITGLAVVAGFNKAIGTVPTTGGSASKGSAETLSDSADATDPSAPGTNQGAQ